MKKAIKHSLQIYLCFMNLEIVSNRYEAKASSSFCATTDKQLRNIRLSSDNFGSYLYRRPVNFSLQVTYTVIADLYHCMHDISLIEMLILLTHLICYKQMFSEDRCSCSLTVISIDNVYFLGFLCPLSHQSV